MKKNNLYIYRDQPAGVFQIEKTIKTNSSFKNFNLKFISNEKINYSNEDIKKYFNGFLFIKDFVLILLHSIKHTIPNTIDEIMKNILLIEIQRTAIVNKTIDVIILSLNSLVIKFPQNFKNKIAPDALEGDIIAQVLRIYHDKDICDGLPGCLWVGVYFILLARSL